jgi:hypothetical protein
MNTDPQPAQNNTQAVLPTYDSNPFTLSFKGFSLLVEFAKSVFITLIVLGILGSIGNLFNSFDQNLTETSRSNETTIAQEANFQLPELSEILIIAGVVIGISIIVLLVSIVLSSVYKGFVSAGAVSASEKRMISFSEALNAMADRFTTLFKAEIITTLKIIGGYLLFIIPGVRAQLRYQAVPYLIMADPKLSASEAIKESKRLYNKHLMEVFGILTVSSLMPFIGSAFGAGGMALSAQQIKAYDAIKAQTPQTHWLNYLGILLLVLLFGFIFFVIGIVFLLTQNS